MRREFQLPSMDVAYLNSTGLAWETFVEGGSQWLLVYDRPIPNGYNLDRANVALSIAPGYPEAQLDMAYFFPALARSDGKTIGALTVMTIDNKSFQRWSRHRTTDSVWRPGDDEVSTHLCFMDTWLETELAKR